MKFLATIIISVMVLTMAGCQTGIDEVKLNAKQKWSRTRASVACDAADEQLRIGDINQAYRQAREAVELAPKLARARMVLGKVLIARGQYQTALAELHHALEIAPGSSNVLYLLGVAYEKHDKLAQACDYYHRALDADSSNFDAAVAAAEVLASIDMASEGLELLEKHLGNAGNSPAGFEVAGHLSLMLGDYQKAESYFLTASSLDSDNIIYLEQLGKAQMLCRNYEDAIISLEKIVNHEKYKTNFLIYTILGNCYLATGRGIEARDVFFQASEISPGQVRVWIGLARSYLAINDCDRAVLAAAKALEIDGQNLAAAMVQGYALLGAGRTSAAMDALTTTASIYPKNPTVQCLLGRVYTSNGDNQAAKGCYKLALSIDPKNQFAKELLDSLREQ